MATTPKTTAKTPTPASTAKAALDAAKAAREDVERRAAAADLLNQEASDRLRAAAALGTSATGVPTSTATPAATSATSSATPTPAPKTRWGSFFGRAARLGCLALIFVLVLALVVGGAAFVALSTTGTTGAVVAPTSTSPIAPTDASIDATTIAPTDAPTSEPTDVPTSAPTDAPTEAPTSAPILDWGSPISAGITFEDEGNPKITTGIDAVCWGTERRAMRFPSGTEIPEGILFWGGCAPESEFWGDPLRRLYEVGVAQGWHRPDQEWSWAN